MRKIYSLVCLLGATVVSLGGQEQGQPVVVDLVDISGAVIVGGSVQVLAKDGSVVASSTVQTESTLLLVPAGRYVLRSAGQGFHSDTRPIEVSVGGDVHERVALQLGYSDPYLLR